MVGDPSYFTDKVKKIGQVKSNYFCPPQANELKQLSLFVATCVYSSLGCSLRLHHESPYT